jgi:hypothetical protein
MPKMPEVTIGSAANRALAIRCKWPALKSNYNFRRTEGFDFDRYRILVRAKGAWDYQIKGIDSENCRFVQTLVGSGGNRLLCFAETISEMVVR